MLHDAALQEKLRDLEQENWKLRQELDCKANKLKAALALIERLTAQLNAKQAAKEIENGISSRH